MNYEHEEELVRTIDGRAEPYICHMNPAKAHTVCTQPHSHEYIEVLYCTGGIFDIWLNGKYFNFTKGDLVVINSHEIHTIKSQTEGHYIVLRFLPEIIYAAGNSAFEAKYITPFIINNSKHQRVFRDEEISETDIPGRMVAMLEEYAKKPYGYELAMRTHIGSIFLWILRYWNSKNMDLTITSSVSNDLLEKIQQVMDYITEHFSEEITASDAAAMCNVSYSYFSRIFKQITKHSFSEYINYVRITEAEKLLASTDMNMTEIAMRTGFSTSSYFIQQFKLQKRISPKQFRKNLLGEL